MVRISHFRGLVHHLGLRKWQKDCFLLSHGRQSAIRFPGRNMQHVLLCHHIACSEWPRWLFAIQAYTYLFPQPSADFPSQTKSEYGAPLMEHYKSSQSTLSVSVVLTSFYRRTSSLQVQPNSICLATFQCGSGLQPQGFSDAMVLGFCKYQLDTSPCKTWRCGKLMSMEQFLTKGMGTDGSMLIMFIS